MSKKEKKSTAATPHILPKGEKYFESSQSQSHFPVGVYFTNKFGTAASCIETERECLSDIIPYLDKYGELILDYTNIPSNKPSMSVYENGYFIDETEASGVRYYAYKDTVISLRTATSRKLKKEKNNYNISISYKPGSPSHLEDFEKFFVVEEIKNGRL